MPMNVRRRIAALSLCLVGALSATVAHATDEDGPRAEELCGPAGVDAPLRCRSNERCQGDAARGWECVPRSPDGVTCRNMTCPAHTGCVIDLDEVSRCYRSPSPVIGASCAAYDCGPGASCIEGQGVLYCQEHVPVSPGCAHVRCGEGRVCAELADRVACLRADG